MAKILIIDDSLYMRQTVERILTEGGHKVILAEDGDEGINLTATHKPDCVILDLLMPDVDGFDVLSRLRQARSTIPIIIFSSDIQESARKRCFDLGAFDFLDKPPAPGELLKMVQMAVRLVSKGQVLLLTERQEDVLKEMINIGVGKGADMLNAILDTHIKLEVPFVRVLSQSEFKEDIKLIPFDTLAAVNLSFNGDLNGNVELVFPTESAVKLVAALTGSDPETIVLDTIHTGTLSEIGNIVINAVIGSISNLLELKLTYSAPNYIEGDYEKLSMAFRTGKDSIILQARARFIIDMLSITGNIVLFLEVDSLDKIFNLIEQMEANEKRD
ncbi:MAG: response regulator [Chitinivibrionales bacterium]|nr:response regulator [Chitinivibrionales bacterium]MBD3357016.1 response regulator [Chitinivibrionales bacterium]